MNNCVFCDEFNKEKKPEIIINGTPWNRVILSDGQWYFVPTLGCFIDGYTLLILSSHRPSLYFCTLEEKKELISFFENIQKLYDLAYHTSFFMFEHGIVNQSLLSPTSVNHVHLHFLPYSHACDQVSKIIRTAGYKEHVLNSFLDLDSIIKQNHIETYLLYYYNGVFRVVDVSTEKLPSQYLRMVIYQIIEKRVDNGWNWKIYPYYQNMKMTYEKLSIAVDKLTSDSFHERTSNYANEADWITDNAFIDPLVPRPFLNKRFLDVACGTGIVTKKAIDMGWDTTALDICEAMLHNVNDFAHKVVGNGEHLQFDEKSFDMVACRQGLQYMNLPKALHEMIRVSAKEIRLLHATVCVEDILTWKRIFYLLGYLGKKIIASNEIQQIIYDKYADKIEIVVDKVLFSDEAMHIPQNVLTSINQLVHDRGFISRNNISFKGNLLSYRLMWHLLILKKRTEK